MKILLGGALFDVEACDLPPETSGRIVLISIGDLKSRAIVVNDGTAKKPLWRSHFVLQGTAYRLNHRLAPQDKILLPADAAEPGPMERRPRRWRDEQLRDLVEKELIALEHNAREGRNEPLAARCRLELNARELSRKAPEIADLVGLSTDCAEKSAQLFRGWPKDKLKRAEKLLKEKPLPAYLMRGRGIVLAELAQQIKRPRRRGGIFVLQGGRADGNKPDKWKR